MACQPSWLQALNLTFWILILLEFPTGVKTAAEDDTYWFILSINQTVTQSSTATNGEATKAVDGRVNPKPAFCSLTNAATNPYFVIDFSRTVFVPLLVIHIDESVRVRYLNAVIKTGDSSDHTTNKVFKVKTLSKFGYIFNTDGRRGRFLSIDVSSTDPKPLSICEIFAYRIPLDSIAFKKPVTMTTVPGHNVNHPALHLVDMSWSSLAMSNLMLNGWMRLDLLDSYYVAEIIYVPYAGHAMSQHHIKIGNSLENEGRSNPSCVKGRNFQFGEAGSFLCGIKGRYIVLLTTKPGNQATGGTELLVNPSHVDNIAEGADVTVSGLAAGSAPPTAATDCRIHWGIVTRDVGTGHWLRVDLGITLPVAKIFIFSHLHKNNEMGDFELRVGDSLIDNGNTNPLCLSGLHSILGKDTASFYCEPRVTGRYVNVHTETAGKSVALAQIAVYSESPPEIKDREKSRDIWHKEGSALTLSCEAYGYPTPVISWLKDGILVQNNSNTLQIDSFNQSGIYECWANNTHGRKYKPINVEITNDYRPCVKSKEILYDLGGSTANAYPKKGEKFDGHKWFRFYDSSVRKYLQMANTAPDNSSVCRGWVSGVHPYVRDGVVERSVCVKENGASCHRQFTVRIRNCFGFYVYNFPPKREADGFSYCFEKERNKDHAKPATAVMTGGMNIALSNHVFHVETEISDSAQCLLMCSLTEKCQSFNFSDMGKVCELNSSTRRKHPDDFLPRDGYHYYMKGKVLLSRKLGDL